MPRRDREEFETRLEKHRGIVFKIANIYSQGLEERDDLVQEIYLQLWRSYPRYDRTRRFSTWMYRVALNTAISFARASRSRERRSVPLDESPQQVLVDRRAFTDLDDRVGLLYRALQTLSELDRALVLLHLEDRSHREVAEIFGISATNVSTKLNRVKEKLRRQLASERKDDSDGAR